MRHRAHEVALGWLDRAACARRSLGGRASLARAWSPPAAVCVQATSGLTQWCTRGWLAGCGVCRPPPPRPGAEVLRAVPIDVAIPHLRARLGEGDITWRKGDLVRVTKPGSNVGKLAVIRDPNWSGRIKVQLYEYGAADDAGDGAGAGQGSPRGVFKSYLSHEIERADAAEMRG